MKWVDSLDTCCHKIANPCWISFLSSHLSFKQLRFLKKVDTLLLLVTCCCSSSSSTELLEHWTEAEAATAAATAAVEGCLTAGGILLAGECPTVECLLWKCLLLLVLFLLLKWVDFSRTPSISSSLFCHDCRFDILPSKRSGVCWTLFFTCCHQSTF